jgi:hypothetical protein
VSPAPPDGAAPVGAARGEDPTQPPEAPATRPVSGTTGGDQQ